MHSLIHSTERKKKIYDPQFIISSRDFYLEIILIYTHINKNRINSVKISLINALTSLFVFSPPPPPPSPTKYTRSINTKVRNSWRLEANFPCKRYNLVRDTLRCLRSYYTGTIFFLFFRKKVSERKPQTQHNNRSVRSSNEINKPRS